MPDGYTLLAWFVVAGLLIWMILTAVGIKRRSPRMFLWGSIAGMFASVAFVFGPGMCLFFVMAVQMLVALIMPRTNDPLYPPALWPNTERRDDDAGPDAQRPQDNNLQSFLRDAEP